MTKDKGTHTYVKLHQKLTVRSHILVVKLRTLQYFLIALNKIKLIAEETRFSLTISLPQRDAHEQKLEWNEEVV